MRYGFNTLRFETDPGLDPGAGGEEPAVDEPAVDEAPAAPAFDYSSPEFQEAVGQAAMQALGPVLQPLFAEPEQEGQQPSEFDLDLFDDPAALQQRIDQLVESKLEQRMARYEPTIEAMEVANWQDKIDRYAGELDTVKQIGTHLPEELPPDQRPEVLVERLATAFLPEMRNIYGDSDRALEGSMRAAADYALPLIKAAHAAGYAARNAELQRLSGAPAPPPQQGGEVQLVDEPEDEFAAFERYSARHNLR